MTSTPTSVQVNSTPKRVSKMGSNLNHLLNFTLPPRQTGPASIIPRRSRKTGTGQGVWNKERFVNAQYRFVMNPTGDYTVHFADPDIFFQWHDILQVIVPRSSALATAAASGDLSGQPEGHTTCPICLSPPAAPRMTKCGHVFCFPCILHYLSTSDNKWARCPICFDSVNERQLKSVKWYEGPVYDHNDSEGSSTEASSSSPPFGETFEITPRAGSSLHMCLIQRPQITTLALPRSHTWPSDLVPPHQAPFHFLPDVFSFAKFMLATPTYLISDLTKELDELAAERHILGGMHDDLGLYFVNGAEEKVRQQIEKATALETSVLKERIEKAQRDQKEIEERIAFHSNRRKAEEAVYASAAPNDVPTELLASRTSTLSSPPVFNLDAASHASRAPYQGRPNAPRQRRNINPPPPSTSTYYYYQAASGLPIFLHPLDIKILLSHFSGYPSFPDNITIRVDSFSEGTVNDDLRKRCKYLAHLPEGADVVFIEADLDGVVGADGLKNFEGPLKMRASRRKEKVKKDDRAKARAEEREKEKEKAAMSTYSSSNSRSIDFLVNNSSATSSAQSPYQDHSQSVPPPSPPVVSGAWGARSFASALHSSTPSPITLAQQRTGRREVTEEEFDLEEAWHDLEQRTMTASGRKKRGPRMVVLGGAGARRR